MNDIELRAQFDQWAAPLRAAPPPGLAAIRHRARRRTARLAATISSALVLTAALAVVATSSLAGPAPSAAAGFWGSAKFPAPPGQPYVFVNTSASGPAEIRDMATGTVIKVLRPLRPAVNFTAVAPAAGDRLFVLAQQDEHGRVTFAEARITGARITGARIAGARIAGARITASRTVGASVQLIPVLPRVRLDDAEISGMTVNPAGTRLALNTVPPDGATSGALVLYNLTTGALLGRWPESSTGIVNFLDWVGGDRLVIDWPSTTDQVSSGPRLLTTAAAVPAGSSLLADSRPDRAVHGDGLALTEDGSTALRQAEAAGAVEVKEVSARSGKVLFTIPLGPATALRGPYFCGVLWASANGRDLLTQCGTRQQEIRDATATPVRLAWTFLAQQDGAIDTFAW